MRKVIIDSTAYFVGSGVEMRRVYRRLCRDFYTLYVEQPQVNPAATYYVRVDWEATDYYGSTTLPTVEWGNLRTLVEGSES